MGGSQQARSEDQHLVTIKVRGKVFKAQKPVLVKDSPYFDRALNGPFLEGQTQTIDLEDDVDPKDFSVYVDSAYRLYFNKDFKLSNRVHVSTCDISGLWVLADRFLNVCLQALATEGMGWKLKDYTVQFWESRYRTSSDPSFGVISLQKIFNSCSVHAVPVRDMLAEAAAAMPPQLFSELHNTLDTKFRSAVTKGFMKRFKNPNLKRPLADGESRPAKRQKQD